MQIIKKVVKKSEFVPMDATEQTLFNIFSGLFNPPVHEMVTIPEATAFSQMSPEESAEGVEFDTGDNGKAADDTLAGVDAEMLLLGLLGKFNDRDKIIILFQVVRSAGYHLTHDDCAKTVGITRERYMVLLKNMKKRAAKILQIPAR